MWIRVPSSLRRYHLQPAHSEARWRQVQLEELNGLGSSGRGPMHAPVLAWVVPFSCLCLTPANFAEAFPATQPLAHLQGFEQGVQEVHLQAWGSSVQRMFSVAMDLAGIDPARIVVSSSGERMGMQSCMHTCTGICMQLWPAAQGRACIHVGAHASRASTACTHVLTRDGPGRH